MSALWIVRIASLTLLTGCTCQPERVPVPTPVEVEVVRYVEVPPELLRCVTDDDRPTTNGELLESWRSRGDRLAECWRSVDAVRGLR